MLIGVVLGYCSWLKVIVGAVSLGIGVHRRFGVWWYYVAAVRN